MSKVAYFGISKDNTFSMFFRPRADIYAGEDNRIHFCYLDAEGKDEEFHQEDFYTDFPVESPEEILKILESYHLFRLDIDTDEPIKDAKPVEMRLVKRVVKTAFLNAKEELSQHHTKEREEYLEDEEDLER